MQCSFKVPFFTFTYLEFEVVAFLPIQERSKHTEHNESFVQPQMIKLFARLTSNTKNLVDKEKEANLCTRTSHDFALVCMRYLATT